MVIGHTPAQLGDDPIVRLRFAPLMPSATRAARVALKEREKIRPPDPEKLGEKLGHKEAVAGSSKFKYDENRWAKIPDPRTGVLSDDPYKNPYPWFGRAFDVQAKWIKQARDFQRKVNEKALQTKNEKMKNKIQCVKDREAKLVQKETTGAIIRQAPARRRPVQEKTMKVKHEALAATCSGLISAVGGDAEASKLSTQEPLVIIDGPVAPPKYVGGFVKQKEPERYNMYRVDNPLAAAKNVDPGERARRATAFLLLSKPNNSWSRQRSQDLATEIAIVLELEDSGVQIERVLKETGQSSAADSIKIQFSIGRSCEQDGCVEDSFLDPEFFSNLLLSFVYAVRSKHGGIMAEEKTRFSNLVVHKAQGLMEMIEGMPLLSCVVDVEVKETKRKERERSLGKFSQDQEDTRRKIVDLIVQHQAYEDDTLLILLLQFVGYYGGDDMVLQVLMKCVEEFALGDRFIQVFEKIFLPFEHVSRGVRSKEKGGKHFENFLNQLHALHVESEEAYPLRTQVDVREHINTFVDYLSLYPLVKSTKYEESVSSYLRYAEISRVVQQVSKLGDELSGKELGDEEKIFEENVNKVIVLIDKHYGDYVEDAKSYTRLFHLALQKMIERWSPSEREDVAAIILLGFELFFASAAESCDEEELTIMTREYLSEMGLEDEMINLACGDIASFFVDRRRVAA
ncbi:hypothetical protein GUITHDRAFT_161037 [Guillardia theta CCMP2712]|uniref:Uncharacterized protein n=2 Tax=Guillardia theta TaxID=55529 RepID=L1JYH9_GUITC|nr:hypothetical protein GUITHDRAFT_161037 [Guillardia theta CCMP2712]EKX53384.1 hypothetical protein GUITHDRAFT_161037 [Guillardia theta CCMP2712]|eukprot:XP_005840364.1 hypothetical protein GUITHDRAFT_161037 [Guillardia theta CCMP2712]